MGKKPLTLGRPDAKPGTIGNIVYSLWRENRPRLRCSVCGRVVELRPDYRGSEGRIPLHQRPNRIERCTGQKDDEPLFREPNTQIRPGSFLEVLLRTAPNRVVELAGQPYDPFTMLLFEPREPGADKYGEPGRPEATAIAAGWVGRRVVDQSGSVLLADILGPGDLLTLPQITGLHLTDAMFTSALFPLTSVTVVDVALDDLAAHAVLVATLAKAALSDQRRLRAATWRAEHRVVADAADLAWRAGRLTQDGLELGFMNQELWSQYIGLSRATLNRVFELLVKNGEIITQRSGLTVRDPVIFSHRLLDYSACCMCGAMIGVPAGHPKPIHERCQKCAQARGSGPSSPEQGEAPYP
ncbi:hypothetical protein [Streptomyces bluensis]|uniref:hypothetical protein n=1 Tax=Streptomyces bluensis TaxID=33897 RepID=UPI003327AA85